MSTEKRTYNGRCACGYAKYTVALPSDISSALRCNCSYCQKFGFTGIKDAKDSFKLISPESLDKLSEYKNRRFCPTCSVIVVSSGSYEYEGVTYDHWSLNANTIDQPQEGLDLSKLKIEYYDGLNDNWMAGVKDKPYPGGLI